MTPRLNPSHPSIETIDCGYYEPLFAAAYLMVEGSEAAFIDNNTTYSVPRLLEALKKRGLSPEQVRYVIITHVHLDHAGGSSALMKACPNATLLAHPRAATHMIDPSRLVSSARKVYGDETFERLYGAIDPIPASRVREMADGESLRFGSRDLRFIHTRGHANHHFCIYDSGSNGIFTGDAFGLSYPALQDKGLFIFPSTSPTDFEPGEARASIDKIVATGASQAYLTHFGPVNDLKEGAQQLKAHLDWSEALLNEAIRSPLADSELDAFCEEKLWAHYRPLIAAEHHKLIQMDIELNAQGIAHVARKKRSAK